MGMFTEAVEPETGLLFQFKTGHDDCKIYKIGDKIPWNPSFSRPDVGIDRVYEAWGDEERPGPHRWVVVADSTLVAVLPIELSYDDITNQYKFTKPDSDLWSQEVRDRYQKIKEDLERKTQEFEESIKDLSGLKKTIARLGRSLNQSRDYNSFARLAFKVEDLSDGAAPEYESRSEE